MSLIADKLGRPRGPYQHGLLAEPECWRCPLRNSTKVLPDGPVPARIAFVGEEPGRQEVGQGKGFVGPSGRLLWQLAAQTKLTLKQQYDIDLDLFRDDIWVTNGTLCRASKIRLSNGGELKLSQVKSLAAEACRSRLVNELRQVDPVVIVPLGSWSLWALSDMPKAKIYAYRGSRIRVDLDELAANIAAGTTRAPKKLQ